MKKQYKYGVFLLEISIIIFLFALIGCIQPARQQEEKEMQGKPEQQEGQEIQGKPEQQEEKEMQGKPEQQEEQEIQGQTENEQGSREQAEEELEELFSLQVYDTKEFFVEDEATARTILKLQGEARRKDAEKNSQVREIESYLENTYGIEAVNLQNMDVEMAQSVQTACDYMYGKYPILQGFLTNITVQEEISESDAAIAKYEISTFLTNPDTSQLYPFVIKREILLREQEFYKPQRLKNIITRNVREGFWPKGTSVESIVVHELTHTLIDSMISKEYGLFNSIHITQENGDAFGKCSTQDLASNQEYVKQLCKTAYEEYVSQCDTACSYEEFCLQISTYGQGVQEDGGISYEETVAEAMADFYINGDNCSDAARMIVSQIEKRIEKNFFSCNIFAISKVLYS